VPGSTTPELAADQCRPAALTLQSGRAGALFTNPVSSRSNTRAVTDQINDVVAGRDHPVTITGGKAVQGNNESHGTEVLIAGGGLVGFSSAAFLDTHGVRSITSSD
jgi:threonine dehydrogenase-like Zn-dependent dehydrogenase